MPLFHLFLVAVVQGITEFLPISSSAHLILLPALTGMPDQGQFIDVSVHVGTLAAVILYFRRDVALAARGFGEVLRGRITTQGGFLALGLTVATIPALLAGFVIHVTGTDAVLRSVTVIGWTTLIFGIFLYVADQRGAQSRTVEQWTLRHALILGLWQALALVPGTSRSGITISGARMLGYSRSDAARLSMLMSIPIITASGMLLAGDALAQADMAALRDGAVAAGLACVSALLALAAMMRLLRFVSYTPYVAYRIVLGLSLLAWAYS